MKMYKVIALMSGTSLDGLDMAYCHYRRKRDGWDFQFIKTRHIDYEDRLRESLRTAISLSALEHRALHHAYGTWLGEQVRAFAGEEKMEVDLIASHGHTSHHRPDLGITLQLGCGQHLANTAGIQTVSDFRSNDVALDGQGAPLVPIGDHILFGNYSYCLNLGGISNISFMHGGKRIAYDIGVANMLLNYIANKAGLPFDEGGVHAASGSVNRPLLDALNALPYYTQTFPKSTGYEWFLQEIVPLVETRSDTLENLLCTGVYHIAGQVALQVTKYPPADSGTLLVTGGGAHNTYMIDLLRQMLGDYVQVEVPERQLVDYKEALVFGLMGVLRLEKEINILASVTGANRDSVSGVLYLPNATT